jgi:hypothetical protein
VSEFYVYHHKNPKTGEIFYVGKGCKRRAWDKRKRSDRWKTVTRLHRRGQTNDLRISERRTGARVYAGCVGWCWLHHVGDAVTNIEKSICDLLEALAAYRKDPTE